MIERIVVLALLCGPLVATAEASIRIGGKTLRCETASEVVLDPYTPSPGMAHYPSGTLILNPDALRSMSNELKWFIFHHECAHLHGYEDEKEADEWAIEVAYKEGWLTANVLGQICRSWGPMDAPATRSHPAPRDRCNSLRTVVANLENPNIRTGRRQDATGQSVYVRVPAPLPMPTSTSTVSDSEFIFDEAETAR